MVFYNLLSRDVRASKEKKVELETVLAGQFLRHFVLLKGGKKWLQMWSILIQFSFLGVTRQKVEQIC